MMHSSIGRAGVQWNIPVLSYLGKNTVNSLLQITNILTS